MSNQTPNYETPRITDHGDLVALTATQAQGSTVDQNLTQGQVPQPGGLLSGGTGFTGVITSRP